MGCWNGTCGLSGLPIISGEEIYVFPIVESYRDSFCYSTALYRPSVIPFRAKYNDYGAGEECSGVGLELIIDGIRESLVEMEIGENKYHDIAVKREGFDVDMFFEAIHEKRLRVPNALRGYEGEPQTKSIFFTMIRKDVVDRLWNEWAFDFWKPRDMKEIPEGFESDTYYIKNVTYAKLSELIPDYMEQQVNNPLNNHFQKAVDKLTDTGDNETAKLMEDLYRREYFFGDGNREHMLSSTFGHAFNGGYSDGGFARFGNVKDKIIDSYFNGDKDTCYELLKECMIGKMVSSFMEATRKVWLPVMHQGSQSEEYNEYRLMNKITTDVMNAREKYFEEDEE